MNVTLMVCALAMGGWSFPEQVDNTPPLFEDISQPPAYTPWYTSNVRTQQPADLGRMTPPSLNQGGAQPGRTTGPRDRQTSTGLGGSPTGNGQGPGPIIPNQPTDLTGGAPGLLPVPPTTKDGTGTGYNTGGRAGLPATPTRSLANLNPGVQPPVMRPPAQFGADLAPQQNPMMFDKPHSNVKPAAAVTTSPWQRLYSPTGGVNTDNFGTYVAPLLNQTNTNQYQSARIGGLQNTMQQQQRTAPPSRGPEVPMGQGLVNPSSFIYYGNTGGYFPSGGAPPMGQ